MQLIDTHCHLYLEPLASRSFQVLERARAAFVDQVIVPAYDRFSWNHIQRFLAHDNVFAAYGIHPWVIEKEALDLAVLDEVLYSARVVAVGEVGLDFAIHETDRHLQISQLTQQIELALEHDLPVILHCRQAYHELIAILRDYAPKLRPIIHGFSRGPNLAQQLVRFNCAIAFGPLVTRKAAHAARSAAQELPIEYLLLESDAPSAAGQGLTKDKGEPGHVLQVAEAVAHLRNTTVEEIAHHTTANARRIFKI